MLKKDNLEIGRLYSLFKRSGEKLLEVTYKAEVVKEGVRIVMTDGIVSGKQAVNFRIVTEGKNIGKANETTVEEQALSDMWAIISKKFDDGYFITIDEANANEGSNVYGFKMPMLAKPFDNKKDTTYPYYVQPKFDGVRCIVTYKNKELKLFSRKGKSFDFSSEEFKVSLKAFCDKYLERYKVDSCILDGELYTKELTFEKLVSVVKAPHKSPKEASLVYFQLFDIVEDISFMKRIEKMNALMYNESVVFTKCTLVSNYEELKKEHTINLQNGYEGTMVRTINGKYESKRSNHLKKLKDFQEEEFTIVDVIEAENDPGTAIFVCEHKNNQFHVRPMGKNEMRSEYLLNRERLLGKLLSVRFQEYTDKNVPRFPVGVAVRDYE